MLKTDLLFSKGMVRQLQHISTLFHKISFHLGDSLQESWAIGSYQWVDFKINQWVGWEFKLKSINFQ